jgi:F-type H+-transporting ATPase subunit gamma
MKSAADIKKRIKSVANTQQITKAMEVVSATKMRKSQDLALKARPYAFAAFELLAAASTKMKAGEKLPALLMENDSKKTLAVIIASDKGLAGSLNANVMRKALATINDLKAAGEVDLVSVGKKGREFFSYRGHSFVKEFVGHGDFVDITEMGELHDFISEQFLTGVYGKVVFVYTNFLSTLRQEPVVRQVLPISRGNLNEMIEGLTPDKGKYSDSKLAAAREEREPYLFEPSREEVLKELTDRLFKMELYHIQLESNASEHSARMVAMKTASENAEEIVDDLTLIYNKGRQAKITQEIMEITSGSDAVG